MATQQVGVVMFIYKNVQVWFIQLEKGLLSELPGKLIQGLLYFPGNVG